MSKEIILKYCDTVETHDIDHLQNAIENKRLIEKGEYRYLNGCPMSYGLDDYVGLCEINPLHSSVGYERLCDQCEACWKKALDVK